MGELCQTAKGEKKTKESCFVGIRTPPCCASSSWLVNDPWLSWEAMWGKLCGKLTQ